MADVLQAYLKYLLIDILVFSAKFFEYAKRYFRAEGFLATDLLFLVFREAYRLELGLQAASLTIRKGFGSYRLSRLFFCLAEG
jgi:hypothetical protein